MKFKYIRYKGDVKSFRPEREKQLFSFIFHFIFQYNLHPDQYIFHNNVLMQWCDFIVEFESLKILIYIIDEFLVALGFFTIEPLFKVRKQMISAGGSIWLGEQLEFELVDCSHRNERRVGRCDIVVKHDLFSQCEVASPKNSRHTLIRE